MTTGSETMSMMSGFNGAVDSMSIDSGLDKETKFSDFN